jgi:cytochrome P450
LVEGSDGDVVFDASVAPMLAFGEGPRGCFGQKFALLEMRIFYSLILWNFELDGIHPSLMDFKAVEELTINPESVRVKLSAAR